MLSNNILNKVKKSISLLKEEVTLVGIDLAEKVYQVCYIDHRSNTSVNTALTQSEFINLIQRNDRKYIFGMEACSRASAWACEIEKYNNESVVIPADVCRSFNFANKDDKHDAQGVLTALLIYLTQASCSFKECIIRNSDNLKEKFILKNLEFLKSEIAKASRALVSFLKEELIDIKLGCSTKKLISKSEEYIRDNKKNLDLQTQMTIDCIQYHLKSIVDKEHQMAIIESKFISKYVEKNEELYHEQMKIKGVGVKTLVTSSIIIQDDYKRFASSRDFAAYIGLVPYHRGTGGKNKVTHISHGGNKMLRAALFEAANAVLATKGTRYKADILKYGRNRTCIKIANKIARQLWCVAVDGHFNPRIDIGLGVKTIRSKISNFTSKARKRFEKYTINNAYLTAINDELSLDW